jgi:hypothetical protein
MARSRRAISSHLLSAEKRNADANPDDINAYSRMHHLLQQMGKGSGISYLQVSIVVRPGGVSGCPDL